MKRRVVRAALLLLLATFCFFWFRRRSEVRPPPAAAVDSVVVRVLATGLHSGLLLPCGEGRVVEYGYGEWGWYAQMKTSWWRAPVIALVPSQGAIGRRYLREADLEAMGRKYGGGTIAPVRVPRAAAAELLAKLDAEFAAGGEPYLNVAYDMTFVRCPERFHLFHECHDETAAWLRELGCDVQTSPIRVGLEVRDDPSG